MDNEFYTKEDIQLLTGKDMQEIELIIKSLNEELMLEYEKHHIKPLLYEEKILKDYFMKRMEINL